MMMTRTRSRARSASPSSPIRQNRAECLLFEQRIRDAVDRAEKAEERITLADERTARAETQMSKTIARVRQQLQQEFKEKLQDIKANIGLKQLRRRLAQAEKRERETKDIAKNAEKSERETKARLDMLYNTQQESARREAEKAESREKITREREALIMIAELEEANKRSQETEMREEEANARSRVTSDRSASMATNHANVRPTTDLRSMPFQPSGHHVPMAQDLSQFHRSEIMNKICVSLLPGLWFIAITLGLLGADIDGTDYHDYECPTDKDKGNSHMSTKQQIISWMRGKNPSYLEKDDNFYGTQWFPSKVRRDFEPVIL